MTFEGDQESIKVRRNGRSGRVEFVLGKIVELKQWNVARGKLARKR
jgi:hypothetical protein